MSEAQSTWYVLHRVNPIYGDGEEIKYHVEPVTLIERLLNRESLSLKMLCGDGRVVVGDVSCFFPTEAEAWFEARSEVVESISNLESRLERQRKYLEELKEKP